VDAPVVGAVLNSVQRRRSYGGYHYRYAYGYGSTPSANGATKAQAPTGTSR